MAGSAKRVTRKVVLFILLAVAAVPASAITTLALLPLWRVIESRFVIESVGHSGPADWCFKVVYVGLLMLTVLGWVMLAGRAGRQ